MQIDLVGRVNNVYLPQSKPLNPLFEAVVNSINAIEESGGKNGKIDIIIERDDSQEEMQLDEVPIQKIKNILIRDNGIGFNSSNYESFLTSDTTFKANKGAKGIGRFLWLKAFNLVKVESVYKEEKQKYKREFEFELSGEGIRNDKVIDAMSDKVGTTVRLIDFKENYKNSAPRKLEIIAHRIIEHCLVYFLMPNCPQVSLSDGTDKIILNEAFREIIQQHSTIEEFELKGHHFKITSLKLYLSDANKHKIHYCAHNRDVISDNLVNDIPDLSRKIKDEYDNHFVYLAYVVGKYLDDKVNSERTDFNFAKDEEIFESELSKRELKEKIVEIVERQLSQYLESINEQKYHQLENYIQNEAPQYRPILKYKDKILKEIPIGMSPDKLDIELYKVSSKIESQLKSKAKEILNTDIKEIDDYEKYSQDYNSYIDEVNEFGKSKLVQYIIHRKLILDLLNNKLSSKDDGKYNLEEGIHKIIFPLKKTSEDVEYSNQNLWIIDEKLSYHRFLSSDLPLNQIKYLLTDSKDRPDLFIIFDSPFVFVDSESPFNSIVIVEFKRPMRNQYNEDEDNPISQVLGYIRKIKDNGRTDMHGRPIIITSNTRFYCYIICDLTKKIREFSENNSLTQSSDNLGYFGYNPNLSAYIEIISYDKLYSDALKRNKILFEQLGLPIK